VNDELFLATVITSGIVAGVPLLYASLGEILAEQSGVLNVGLEGMMLVGALAGRAARSIEADPLLAQAAASFEIWTGIRAPIDVMRVAL